MRFHLLLFILGFLMITAGYAKQNIPSCGSDSIRVKFVPRTVFDEISQEKAFTELDENAKEYGALNRLDPWYKSHMMSPEEESDRRNVDKKMIVEEEILTV